MNASNPMSNANGFKLGLFSINAEGGTSFTKVPDRWRAEWSEIETLAQTADTAGSSSFFRLRAGRVTAARPMCAVRLSRL
jgi:hypothetical protein